VHEALPKLVEASLCADKHNAIAAHWLVKAPAGSRSASAAGTYVISFNEAGLISNIEAYIDGSEDEFLEA
jgi:hypothetical protein